jgi:hypothetical protein
MDAVIFDGKEYLKASVVAERFNYTQDYVGQLCRGKKVDARLVGRAWYINLDSLHTHKKARYKDKTSQSTAATEAHPPKPAYLSRIDVEPVLNKKTVKLLRNVGDRLTEFSVKYESDDHSLIPHVNRESVNRMVAVLPAGAEDLPVSNVKEAIKVTNFKADPLPEVYLKGKLHVDGLPEDVEDEHEILAEVSKKPRDFPAFPPEKHLAINQTHTKSHEEEAKKPIKIKLHRNNHAVPRTFERPQAVTVKRVPLSEVSQNHEKVQPLAQPVRHSLKPSFQPTASMHQRVLPTPAKEVVIPHATFKAMLILLIATSASASLLFLQTATMSSAGSVFSTWSISFEPVQKIESFFISK